MFHFDIEKTLEAVAVLLRKETSKGMNYMKLLKLLYICDREGLKETGQPITGDHAVAMKRGPLLSHLYAIIKGEHPKYAQWEKYFRKDRYDVFLFCDPGIARLCKYEIEKLSEVWTRYQEMDEFEMVEITHEFPEWQKNNPGESSRPIPLDDILEAVNCSEHADSIRNDAMINEIVARTFGV